MNTNHEMPSLDDIVFENRNKEYGAYVIRKHYSDSLNRAVILSLGFVALIFAFPLVFRSDKVIPDVVKPIPVIEFVDPPPIMVEKIKQTISSRVQKAVRDLTPLVTTAPEPDIPQEIVAHQVAGIDEGIEGGEPLSTGTFETEGEVVTPAVPEFPKVWDHSEILPAYKGGMEAMVKFLSKHIRYPAVPRRNGIEGTVLVSFIVGMDGKVIQAVVVRGVSKECDAEALRVINLMPTWNPGLQGGNPVMVRMVLPIKFQLQ